MKIHLFTKVQKVVAVVSGDMFQLQVNGRLIGLPGTEANANELYRSLKLSNGDTVKMMRNGQFHYTVR